MLKNTIKIFMNLIAIVSVLVFTQGCGSDSKDSAKSMEQIQEEMGIPVKIAVIETRPFNKYLSFYSKLSGVQEATKMSLIGGKIEKIYAKAGDYVKEHQVIVEFAKDNPKTQYEQTKTAFENSEKIYQRTKALYDAGESSEANFDAVQTQYFVNKHNYESQRQMLFIESPFNGYVVDMKVNEGDNVKSDIYLFTVANISKMRGRIWASSDEISNIRKGMTALVELNGKNFTGKVMEISLAADPEKQAFYAEIEFDNSHGELKSGITVEIKILIYENPNAIIIPGNLVMNDNQGSYVFVESNLIAKKKYITNGTGSGIDYEVKSGLTSGDNLITHGSAQVSDGGKVRVID